uniref:Uncharacterized protein n=1 Tax=Lepeophtheirus salmonis TaxID=72036 RepID=A0A0K2U958_LEPSM
MSIIINICILSFINL